MQAFHYSKRSHSRVAGGGRAAAAAVAAAAAAAALFVNGLFPALPHGLRRRRRGQRWRGRGRL
jgi:hypothetical protein